MIPYAVRLTFPLALIALGAACGGRAITEETGADAGSQAPHPSHPPKPAPAPGDASAPPSTPESPLDYSLSVSDCAARPFDSEGAGSASDIVDGWLRAKIDACPVPGHTTCGDLTVHFSRMPKPACADTLRFTKPPAPELVTCLTKALATERCMAGNFVDGDAHTISLCQ
jgi:hypothetical protein